jgi:hypothetical protein
VLTIHNTAAKTTAAVFKIMLRQNTAYKNFFSFAPKPVFLFCGSGGF